MRIMQRKALCLLTVLALPLPAFGWFGELPPSFTLGKAVPGDAWMVIHGVHNPERGWVEGKWGEVFAELSKSGVGSDLLALAFAQMPEEGRAGAQTMIDKAMGLMQSVDWASMMHEEVVFAETLNPPLPSYYLLARGKAGSGENNFKGLCGILEYVDTLAEEIKVESRQVDGADIRTIGVGGYKFECFRKGDLIGLVAGPDPANEILGLLGGTGAKKSILETPRFKEALSQAKTPEDALMYFDFKMLLANVNGMIAMGMQGQTGPEAEQAKKLVDKMMGLCDIMDYGITTTETDGQRDLTYSINRLQADRMSSPLARMCFTRKPFEKFDQFLPADTLGFSVSGSIDVPLLYSTVMEFIEKDVPDGAEAVAEIKKGLAQVGFDPQADLFEWWSGEMITVQMPAAVQTLAGAPDSVTMIRVKNGELARQKVTAGLTALNAILTEAQGSGFMMGPAQVNAEGFVKIAHPMLMMMQMNPVVGVSGEWLVIASSESAVNRCLDVAAGKAPSIRENPRFKAEGLIPEGPVASVSFTDTSKFGQELGAAIGAMSMGFGMVTAMMPQDPEAVQVKAVIGKVLTIATKLVPVVNKIDFFSSEASITTIEGNVAKTRSVVTYKAKTPPAAATADSRHEEPAKPAEAGK